MKKNSELRNSPIVFFQHFSYENMLYFNSIRNSYKKHSILNHSSTKLLIPGKYEIYMVILKKRAKHNKKVEKL